MSSRGRGIKKEAQPMNKTPGKRPPRDPLMEGSAKEDKEEGNH